MLAQSSVLHYITGMPETVTATQANRQFSELLRKVEAGESVTIMRRGRPVAVIEPVTPEKTTRKSRRELVEFFEKMPVSEPMPWTREELYE